MRTTTILSFAIFLLSCNPTTSFNEEQARQEILELHQLQQAYHLEKRAEEFAILLGEKHLSVNRGKITESGIQENQARFQAYFDAVEFEKWEDIQPPIIRFSDDGSMAYTIVDKEVIVRYPDPAGQTIRDSTHFAWLAIYKKHADGWKIDCVASTNEPGITELVED